METSSVESVTLKENSSMWVRRKGKKKGVFSDISLGYWNIPR